MSAFGGGLRAGQELIVEVLAQGFGVGDRYFGTTNPPTPLYGIQEGRNERPEANEKYTGNTERRASRIFSRGGLNDLFFGYIPVLFLRFSGS